MDKTDNDIVRTITTAFLNGDLTACQNGDHYTLAMPGEDGPTWSLATLLDHLEDCGATPLIRDREAVTRQVMTNAQHLHRSGHLGRTAELVA